MERFFFWDESEAEMQDGTMSRKSTS